MNNTNIKMSKNDNEILESILSSFEKNLEDVDYFLAINTGASDLVFVEVNKEDFNEVLIGYSEYYNISTNTSKVHSCSTQIIIYAHDPEEPGYHFMIGNIFVHK